jgi:hypothetical protein
MRASGKAGGGGPVGAVRDPVAPRQVGVLDGTDRREDDTVTHQAGEQGGPLRVGRMRRCVGRISRLSLVLSSMYASK